MDGDFVDRVLDAIDEVVPLLHAALGLRQVEILEHDAVAAFGCERRRHFVNRRHIARRDDGFFGDVAEERDLPLDVRIKKTIGAAEQDVGLDADRSEVADAVLRRLGLELAGGADVRHERQVDVERVIAADVLAELANRFEEGQALDVAHRAADFDEHDVHIDCDRANGVFDLVGDMRNHLHGAAEVVAAPFLLNDGRINLAGRPVGVLGGQRAGEAFVVAEVEVRLRAVVGDVDLAVLVGAHRPRVDIDIWVELLHRDPVAVAFEETANRGRRETFAKRRHHTAGYENIFGLPSVHESLSRKSAPRAGGAPVQDPRVYPHSTSRKAFRWP